MAFAPIGNVVDKLYLDYARLIKIKKYIYARIFKRNIKNTRLLHTTWFYIKINRYYMEIIILCRICQ